jgi:hypothetical protein
MQQALRHFLRSRCAFYRETTSTSPSVLQRSSLRRPAQYLTLILLVTSWSLIAAAQSETITNPTPRNNSVLLLRNGQTFNGAVTKSAGIPAQYTVIDTLGNQLRFPKYQVEFVSDSILEVYAYRRATQIRDNAPACLALSQWCMQLRLFAQAQEQINKAIIIEGRSPAIARLQIRLDLLRSPPVSRPAPSMDSGVATSIITAEQVQQRIDQFPDGVVHQFIGFVQPLLLNRCALAGCHGPRPTSTFVLFRTSAKRAIPHRVSLRNLYNTLITLDVTQPENSSLLTAATTVHGTQHQPALGIDEPQEIATLVNWVRVVTTAPSHNIDLRPMTPLISQGPILYQHGNSQHTRKMVTPDSDSLPPTLNPPVLPNKLQQWIHAGAHRQPQSALGFGIVLPIEMQGPTLGTMKISPTQRVNLTPGVGGNFPLPSNRILQQKLR